MLAIALCSRSSNEGNRVPAAYLSALYAAYTTYATQHRELEGEEHTIMTGKPPSNRPGEHEHKKRHPADRPANAAPISEEEDKGPALGNQTDMGEQTEQNVSGDQPTKEPRDTSNGEDETASYSNSPADTTHRSAYGSKAGRMDTGGVASTGRNENATGPSDPMKSHSPPRKPRATKRQDDQT